MRAGIVLDDYKLPIYKRHLTAANFTYEEAPALIEGTKSLIVNTDDPAKLQQVLRAADKEAKNGRRNLH